jgi:hypothetical protein
MRPHGKASTFLDWFAETAAILQDEHGIGSTAIRPGTWTSLYIRGMSPAEAAERVATEAINALPASERILRPLQAYPHSSRMQGTK